MPRQLLYTVATVLLGVLAGAPNDALSQAGDGGIDRERLGEVERQIGEAEDVIVEQVLALRRQVEALEARVRALEAGLAAAAPATTPTPPERLR